MNYKHSCVIDASNYYTDLVLVYLEPDESGVIQENIQDYTLKEGERLVDAPLPPQRPHAGTAGLVRPRWNGERWEEGATPEEITAWETDNPAPPPFGPDLRDLAIAQLMREVATLKGGGIGV